MKVLALWIVAFATLANATQFTSILPSSKSESESHLAKSLPISSIFNYDQHKESKKKTGSTSNKLFELKINKNQLFESSVHDVTNNIKNKKIFTDLYNGEIPNFHEQQQFSASHDNNFEHFESSSKSSKLQQQFSDQQSISETSSTDGESGSNTEMFRRKKKNTNTLNINTESTTSKDFKMEPYTKSRRTMKFVIHKKRNQFPNGIKGGSLLTVVNENDNSDTSTLKTTSSLLRNSRSKTLQKDTDKLDTQNLNEENNSDRPKPRITIIRVKPVYKQLPNSKINDTSKIIGSKPILDATLHNYLEHNEKIDQETYTNRERKSVGGIIETKVVPDENLGVNHDWNNVNKRRHKELTDEPNIIKEPTKIKPILDVTLGKGEGIRSHDIKTDETIFNNPKAKNTGKITTTEQLIAIDHDMNVAIRNDGKIDDVLLPDLSGNDSGMKRVPVKQKHKHHSFIIEFNNKLDNTENHKCKQDKNVIINRNTDEADEELVNTKQGNSHHSIIGVRKQITIINDNISNKSEYNNIKKYKTEDIDQDKDENVEKSIHKQLRHNEIRERNNGQFVKTTVIGKESINAYDENEELLNTKEKRSEYFIIEKENNSRTDQTLMKAKISDKLYDTPSKIKDTGHSVTEDSNSEKSGKNNKSVPDTDELNQQLVDRNQEQSNYFVIKGGKNNNHTKSKVINHDTCEDDNKPIDTKQRYTNIEEGNCGNFDKTIVTDHNTVEYDEKPFIQVENNGNPDQKTIKDHGTNIFYENKVPIKERVVHKFALEVDNYDKSVKKSTIKIDGTSNESTENSEAIKHRQNLYFDIEKSDNNKVYKGTVIAKNTDENDLKTILNTKHKHKHSEEANSSQLINATIIQQGTHDKKVVAIKKRKAHNAVNDENSKSYQDIITNKGIDESYEKSKTLQENDAQYFAIEKGLYNKAHKSNRLDPIIEKLNEKQVAIKQEQTRLLIEKGKNNKLHGTANIDQEESNRKFYHKIFIDKIANNSYEKLKTIQGQDAHQPPIAQSHDDKPRITIIVDNYKDKCNDKLVASEQSQTHNFLTVQSNNNNRIMNTAAIEQGTYEFLDKYIDSKLKIKDIEEVNHGKFDKTIVTDQGTNEKDEGLFVFKQRRTHNSTFREESNEKSFTLKCTDEPLEDSIAMKRETVHHSGIEENHADEPNNSNIIDYATEVYKKKLVQQKELHHFVIQEDNTNTEVIDQKSDDNDEKSINVKQIHKEIIEGHRTDFDTTTINEKCKNGYDGKSVAIKLSNTQNSIIEEENSGTPEKNKIKNRGSDKSYEKSIAIKALRLAIGENYYDDLNNNNIVVPVIDDSNKKLVARTHLIINELGKNNKVYKTSVIDKDTDDKKIIDSKQNLEDIEKGKNKNDNNTIIEKANEIHKKLVATKQNRTHNFTFEEDNKSKPEKELIKDKIEDKSHKTPIAIKERDACITGIEENHSDKLDQNYIIEKAIDESKEKFNADYDQGTIKYQEKNLALKQDYHQSGINEEINNKPDQYTRKNNSANTSFEKLFSINETAANRFTNKENYSTSEKSGIANKATNKSNEKLVAEKQRQTYYFIIEQGNNNKLYKTAIIDQDTDKFIDQSIVRKQRLDDTEKSQNGKFGKPIITDIITNKYDDKLFDFERSRTRIEENNIVTENSRSKFRATNVVDYGTDESKNKKLSVSKESYNSKNSIIDQSIEVSHKKSYDVKQSHHSISDEDNLNKPYAPNLIVKTSDGSYEKLIGINKGLTPHSIIEENNKSKTDKTSVIDDSELESSHKTLAIRQSNNNSITEDDDKNKFFQTTFNDQGAKIYLETLFKRNHKYTHQSVIEGKSNSKLVSSTTVEHDIEESDKKSHRINQKCTHNYVTKEDNKSKTHKQEAAESYNSFSINQRQAHDSIINEEINYSRSGKNEESELKLNATKGHTHESNKRFFGTNQNDTRYYLLNKNNDTTVIVPNEKKSDENSIGGTKSRTRYYDAEECIKNKHQKTTSTNQGADESYENVHEFNQSYIHHSVINANNTSKFEATTIVDRKSEKNEKMYDTEDNDNSKFDEFAIIHQSNHLPNEKLIDVNQIHTDHLITKEENENKHYETTFTNQGADESYERSFSVNEKHIDNSIIEGNNNSEVGALPVIGYDTGHSHEKMVVTEQKYTHQSVTQEENDGKIDKFTNIDESFNVQQRHTHHSTIHENNNRISDETPVTEKNVDQSYDESLATKRKFMNISYSTIKENNNRKTETNTVTEKSFDDSEGKEVVIKQRHTDQSVTEKHNSAKSNKIKVIDQDKNNTHQLNDRFFVITKKDSSHFIIDESDARETDNTTVINQDDKEYHEKSVASEHSHANYSVTGNSDTRQINDVGHGTDKSNETSRDLKHFAVESNNNSSHKITDIQQNSEESHNKSFAIKARLVKHSNIVGKNIKLDKNTVANQDTHEIDNDIISMEHTHETMAEETKKSKHSKSPDIDQGTDEFVKNSNYRKNKLTDHSLLKYNNNELYKKIEPIPKDTGYEAVENTVNNKVKDKIREESPSKTDITPRHFSEESDNYNIFLQRQRSLKHNFGRHNVNVSSNIAMDPITKRSLPAPTHRLITKIPALQLVNKGKLNLKAEDIYDSEKREIRVKHIDAYTTEEKQYDMNIKQHNDEDSKEVQNTNHITKFETNFDVFKPKPMQQPEHNPTQLLIEEGETTNQMMKITTKLRHPKNIFDATKTNESKDTLIKDLKETADSVITEDNKNYDKNERLITKSSSDASHRLRRPSVTGESDTEAHLVKPKGFKDDKPEDVDFDENSRYISKIRGIRGGRLLSPSTEELRDIRYLREGEAVTTKSYLEKLINKDDSGHCYCTCKSDQKPLFFTVPKDKIFK